MNPQARLFGIPINALRMDQAVDTLAAWLNNAPTRCRYVVTPNINHIVRLHEDIAFRATYVDADLVLVDGRPVVWTARLLGQKIPEVVPGSDLVPSLFTRMAAPDGMRVYLLGAAPGVAECAARIIETRWPQIRVVGHHSPPRGFEHDAAYCTQLIKNINSTVPDLLVVGLGAPKQELWVHRHRGALQTKVALCVGATIDFLAGAKPRAPTWVRHIGMEWCHRVVTEPRRLASRYARDALIYPRHVWQEWRRL